LRLDCAEELTVNFDLAYFDVSVHDRVFTNHEIVGSRNGSLEIAIDAESAGELEFAGHVGSFV
jgi:hypothetical protein